MKEPILDARESRSERWQGELPHANGGDLRALRVAAQAAHRSVEVNSASNRRSDSRKPSSVKTTDLAFPAGFVIKPF